MYKILENGDVEFFTEQTETDELIRIAAGKGKNWVGSGEELHKQKSTQRTR